jgi:hypothetical protein
MLERMILVSMGIVGLPSLRGAHSDGDLVTTAAHQTIGISVNQKLPNTNAAVKMPL